MKLTILSRLVIGYLVIFVLVIGMSVYAVIRIGQFNDITQSVLRTNNRIVEYSGKLTDAVLSQVRYERKFVITKDRAFHNQFLQLKSDFEQYLDEAMTITDSPRLRSFLTSARESYQTYLSLFEDELEHLGSGRPYAVQWYKDEKEKATNATLNEFEKLRMHTQQNTTDKIRTLYEAGAEARRMAISMTAVFLALALGISFFIHRSITRPILTLKKRTREIAQGNFTEDLHLSSPPEIAELANAFNLMCSKLSELDKMKSDFFSSMSHELRTPLSTIKMGIGLLREGVEGPLTEKQTKLLTILGEESERLIVLVNSLLDFSKMEAGMMTYHMEQKPLAPLIHQAIKEIGPLMSAKKIEVESSVAQGLPAIRIDSERILQVLRNIIGNAAKFTPEGGHVGIRAQLVDHRIEVSVVDSGPGIPRDSLGTIFEKFQQALSKGSPVTKGTGLGLAIAKQIVTYHGGKIWAESEPGQGSTFTFSLPV